MKAKLFTCTASAFTDESLTEMPGFSHRSQPSQARVYWYPFEEWRVKVYLFARNRSHAVKQLRHTAAVRDLDDGSLHEVLACIASRLTA